MPVVITPKYNTNNYSVRSLMDHEIVADVLTHMNGIRRELQIHKQNKRTKVNQAFYAVAKSFGHRSAFRDLVVTHPSAKRHYLMGQDKVIQVEGATSAQLHYYLLLLGRESKKGSGIGLSAEDRLSGNTTMANQIEVDVRMGFTWIGVTMHLTPTAFHRMCADQNTTISRNIGRDIIDMVRGKWGSVGETYNLFSHENGGEGYRYVRKIDGVPSVYQPGWGWHKTG